MEIFDPLRKKNVALTPEEEVRQGVIRTLARSHGVPMTMMASEQGFTWNGLQYRADVLVYGRDAQPLMLVECKAPSVRLSSAVIDQVLRYTRALKVKYIMITNGKSSYLCKWSAGAGDYIFCTSMPDYDLMNEQ